MSIPKLSVLSFISIFLCYVPHNCLGSSSNKQNTKHTSYNIVDYGAVGDGTTMNTVAIESAINSCTESGGGTVVILAGIYLSGTIV